MALLGHTGAPRGKRVLVILRDGQRIVDKFVERTDTAVVLQSAGRILKKNIRSFSILR